MHSIPLGKRKKKHPWRPDSINIKKERAMVKSLQRMQYYAIYRTKAVYFSIFNHFHVGFSQKYY